MPEKPSKREEEWVGRTTTVEMKGGVLHVTVDFVKGDKLVSETFTTSQGQSEDWLVEQAEKKIQALSALEVLAETIQLGEIQKKAVVPLTARDEYIADLETMQKMVNAVQKGVMERESAEYVALKNKLKANFLPEYVELF